MALARLKNINIARVICRAISCERKLGMAHINNHRYNYRRIAPLQQRVWRLARATTAST